MQCLGLYLSELLSRLSMLLKCFVLQLLEILWGSVYQLYWSQNVQRTKKELRERESNVTHARRNPKKLVW